MRGTDVAKRVVLTRHASVRLEERGIRLEWVEMAAYRPAWTEPEPTDPSAERRFVRIDGLAGRALRVVCVETVDTIRVITATFDRGARSPR